ncbi:unnamed protein product [Owenia fusiformis]|uniref:Alkaline ceramidase n=1 Tax=Owenia fusiformis TaxID=6347 RepID=A0A8J1UEY6_OWEFU|nr:unnamed protein product [Owenia fusiformis]
MAPNGYWGERTATIDWCEENYEVNYYIAEFWNTISNVSMILPPIMGAVFAWLDGLEAKIFWSHISLLCVGLGSWCFHMTLLYSGQLLDELPMIWGTSTLIYAMYQVNSPPGHTHYKLIIGLFLYCVAVTAIYIFNKNPVFHEAAYGLMVFTLIYLSRRIMRVTNGSKSWLCFASLVIYATGFVLWNLDHMFCDKVMSVRNSVPHGLRPVTQLHAWWHLFAGLGTHTSIVFFTHSRYRCLKRDLHLKMLGGWFPFVRASSHTKGVIRSNGAQHENGVQQMNGDQYSNGVKHDNGLQNSNGVTPNSNPGTSYTRHGTAYSTA